MRAGLSEDIRRLARFVSGRAVGLVLAGGGARGYAHIGVIKALIEARVPFDHLGGTSMGAIIAAGLALEWGVDELTARMREAFVDTESALRFHVAADCACCAASRLRSCCASISAMSASRNCPSRSSVFLPISPPGAFMFIARGHCGGRCARAWRFRESCRPSPITAICSSMAA